MKAVLSLLVVGLLLVACGDDSQLSSAEREWCLIADASENSAVLFDVIFEAGVGLDLPMDELNAKAGSLNEQYMAEGMTADEAVRAVSTDLLKDDVYVAACQAAFAACPDFLISSTVADEICP